ncbi:MAG TPA: hypothetical protein VIW67_04695, partial [Terriglobales bacterium]
AIALSAASLHAARRPEGPKAPSMDYKAAYSSHRRRRLSGATSVLPNFRRLRLWSAYSKIEIDAARLEVMP